MDERRQKWVRAAPRVYFAISLAVIGLLAAATPLVWHGPWPLSVLGIWTATAFGWVSLAYLLNQPKLLGKRADGSQPIWLWLLLGPFLALTRLTFWAYCRCTSNRQPAAQVVPGLWFARRLTKQEATAAGIGSVSLLDLAAEFPRPDFLVRQYLSLPLLDGALPTDEQFEQSAAWITQQLKLGPVLVHCGFGHGRTGSVVLHWLLQNGHVSEFTMGVARLKELRPGFDLSYSQARYFALQHARPG